MEQKKTWVLIADASKARIFSLCKARVFKDKNPNDLHLEANYTHEDSRKKNGELVTDKQGQFGSGTFELETTPKHHEAEVFAHQLLHHIQTGKAGDHFQDLIIIAPPAFMGLLHKHMPQAIHKLISQNIEKDYTQHDGKELMHNLLSHF